MSLGPSNCLRCNGRYIEIQVISNRPYAQAQVCQCFPDLCPTCKGTRFVFEKDPIKRDIVKACPDCEGLKHHIALYNDAKIPKKYAHSHLHRGRDRDLNNQLIFDLLSRIAKNLKPQNHNTIAPQNQQRGMVLMGPPGTGKTHLMTGFAHQCTLVHGIPTIFQSFDKLLTELKQGFSDGKSGAEIIEHYQQADVLIIDELGKGRNSSWELSVLDTLISERYDRNQMLMVATNYTEDAKTTLQERVVSKDRTEAGTIVSDTLRERVGDRCHSRLKEMCSFEVLLGDDRRLVTSFGA